MTRGRLPRGAVAIVLVTLLGGCAGSAPSMTPTARSASAAPAASMTVSEPPAASEPAITLPEPGQPYDAPEILAAMRDSRRPGGVPAAMQTEAIASEVAAAIWTIDGRPWDRISIGGSCAADHCALEVAGAHAGAAGEDLWAFGVDPGSGVVRVETVTLRSMPAPLAAALDDAVRASHPAPDERGLLLTAVRWRPPPAHVGSFELSYRTGNETGCALEVVFDAVALAVVEESAAEC